MKTYASTIASAGHEEAHAPQLMHLSASITRVSPCSEIASTGQSLSQAPQFTHWSVILNAIVIPLSNDIYLILQYLNFFGNKNIKYIFYLLSFILWIIIFFMTKEKLSSYIDHTLLKAQAVESEIKILCEEAKKYNFASVCVNPAFVAYAKSLLAESSVKVCTVIAFPLGANTTKSKVFEAVNAVENGADEVDMVINIDWAKRALYSLIQEEIKEIVEEAKKEGRKNNKKVIVKVILETCFLTDEEIQEVCLCAKNAKADFVKTSTGFANPKDSMGNALENGATLHHIALMRKTLGPEMGVKASGGIRNTESALAMIEAGATRIGTSSGVQIVEKYLE